MNIIKDDKKKFRRKHRPTASGVMTLSIETMTQKVTVKTGMDCELQRRFGWFWVTIKRYYIAGMQYEENQNVRFVKA